MRQITTSEPETSARDVAQESWTPDWRGAWTKADESWLGTVLQMAEHFEHPHHPVDCQRKIDPHWGRGEWKLLREEEHLTLRQLAAKLDVDAGSISRWESGARWPESVDYEVWLKEAADKLGEQVRMQVFLLQSKRDGWMTEPASRRFDHWQAIFKDGGLFDRWRETGSLPVWTPQDAGFTG